jgi:predicted RNA-binding Zn-ribbon protein involved in translation (DUF1610 family)
VSAAGSAGCPKCGYVRKPQDSAPAWQCPSCGIAIEKYLATRQAAAATPAPVVTFAPVAPVPGLSFASRLGSALPDLGTAWLFAWCWKNPLGWQPGLAAALGQIVLMEFLVAHSGAFFAALVSAEPGAGASRGKLGAALLLCLIYLPFAAAFAAGNGSWWPLGAFAWLLAGRVAMVANSRGWSEFEKKRLHFYWGNGAALYILFCFAAVVLPVPALGFERARVPWSGWAISPQHVMCWGVLYFSALAAMKLLENPRWIESMPGQEASSS